MGSSDVELVAPEELAKLRKDSRILATLRAHGVDNWDWYGDAMAEYYEEHPEDDT